MSESDPNTGNNDANSAPDPSSSPSGFVAPSVEEMNARLPQFEFIDLLGVGGMGAVYKARQPKLNRFVAIKILPRVDNDDFGFAERFEREAQSMAQLSHPHIVPVYDFGETEDGQLYFVMEFVEGADLYQLIQGGQLTPEHFFSWIPQVCSALEYAHKNGIVHRDIKPANILINREGQVRVADFGLAKLTSSDRSDGSLTHKSLSMGTPDYAAPEQIDADQEVDGRADIYALGVVIFQMITGKVPRGAFRNPSDENPAYDSKIDAIVLKAMQSVPADRYQQATEISTDLEKIRHQPDTDTSAIPVAVLAEPQKNSAFGIAAIVTVSLVAIIAIVMALFPSQPDDEDSSDAPLVAAENDRPDKTGSKQENRKPGEKSKDDKKPAHKGTSHAKSTPPESDSNDKPPTLPDKKIVSAPPLPKPGNQRPGGPLKRRMFGKRPPNPGNANTGNTPVATTEEVSPEEEIVVPAEIAEVQARFEELFLESVENPYVESVASLNEFYLNYLDGAEATARAAAELDEVVALGAERQRIENGEAIPETDADNTPSGLVERRTTYRLQVHTYEAVRSAAEIELGQAYLDKLDSIQAELTRAGKTDEALEVRAFRERFAANHATDAASPASAETVAAPTEPIAATEARAAGRRVIAIPAANSAALNAAFIDLRAGDFLLLQPGTYAKSNKRPDRPFALRQPGVTIYGQRSVIGIDLVINSSDVTLSGVSAGSITVGTTADRNADVSASIEHCRAGHFAFSAGSRAEIRNSLGPVTIDDRARVDLVDCTIAPTSTAVLDQPALTLGADSHVSIEGSIISSPAETIRTATDGPSRCSISDSIVSGSAVITLEQEDGTLKTLTSSRDLADVNIEMTDITRSPPRFVSPEGGDFRTAATMASENPNLPPPFGAFLDAEGWPLIAADPARSSSSSPSVVTEKP